MREREKSGVVGKRYFIISHAQIRRGDPADPAAAQHIHAVDDNVMKSSTWSSNSSSSSISITV